MGIWNPWRGCKRKSEGCLHCYIHKGDLKRGVDTSQIVKTSFFDKPIQKKKDGSYKMNGFTYLCFQSDFLIEEADSFREDALKMIQERSDIDFLFLTKRIERYHEVIKGDYPNLWVSVSVENQEKADERLPILRDLKIVHKMIAVQPMLEKIDISQYLEGIELVVCGGESDKEGRPLDYEWVMNLREQCVLANVSFNFRQVGTHFVFLGNSYTIPTRLLSSQARKAGIDFTRKEEEE